MDHRVLDRDPLFTAAFRRLLRDRGVKPWLLPARSPNLNAFAERFVLSIKSECSERMVLLGEAHLRTAALQYLAHDHRERPHHGLRNEVLVTHGKILPNGLVKRRPRLGGLLNFYDREAV